MMRTLALTAALALGLANGAARADLSMCEIDSDFDLRIKDAALTFHRDGGMPAEVEMSDGRLWIDGAEQPLSAADRARVREFESKLRSLVPEVKEIAYDAITLAADAVGLAATSLGGADDSADLVARIEEVRARATARVDESLDTADWSDGEFEAEIEALVEEMVPLLVGNVTAAAVSAALSGDEAAAERMAAGAEAMAADLEREVEARAEGIEARAEALCPAIAELDAIEDSLELRLADNRPLDLFQAEVRGADAD